MNNHMLVVDLRRLLTSMPISAMDQLLWNGDNNPNISRVWKSIRNKGTAPLWLHAIWHSYAIPKCAFFMWLALKNRVLTKERMIHFGLNVSLTYVLCHHSRETVDHLFVNCPYTNLVLKGSLVPLSCQWLEWQAGNFTERHDSCLRKHLAWLYISVVIYCV